MPDEMDIDLLERLEKYNKILEGAGFSKNQRGELLRKYKEYDTELEGKSYEQLARIYKEVYKDTVEYEIMGPDVAEGRFKHIEQKTFRSSLDEEETVDTPDELRAEVRELMRNRDFGRVFDQNLEYDKELAEEGVDTYEEHADYYKRVWKLVHKGTPSENDLEGKNLKDLKHLDTYGELREQTRELMEQHDKLPGPRVRIEKVEEVKPEAGASSVKPDTADENALRAAPAAAGDDEIDIDLLERLEEYNKRMEGAGFSKSQRGELLRKYKEYDTELEGKSYEELVSIYKEVYKDAGGYRPDIAEELFDLLEQKSARSALNQWEIIDTPDELRAEVRELMRARDYDRVLKQEIETPPDSDEQAEPPGSEAASSEGAAYEAADAEDVLRAAAEAAAREAAASDAAPIEGDASSRLIGGEALPSEDLRDEAFSGGKEEGESAPDAAAAATPAAAAEGDEIEMPPDPGAAAKPGGSEGLGQEQPSGEVPTAASTDQGGSPFWGVEETGPPAGDVEIEMPPDSGRAGAAEAGDLGETVAEAGDPGETIEEAAGEDILVDPPADTGAPADVVEPMEDPAADAAYEGVETPPSFVEDPFEGGDLGEVSGEEVVDHTDDPFVDS